jgi:tetratricopeptide (TPR) repeat protein
LFIPTPTATRSAASFTLEAESLFQAGKLPQAEETYMAAILVDPREISYYIELAKVRVFAGKYEDAEIAARDALVIDPDSAIAHAALGWAIDFQAGQTQEPLVVGELLLTALTEVERAFELNSNSAFVRAIYAEVLIDNDIGAYEEALELAQRAVQLDPSMLETHRALGYVWEVTGNYSEAVVSYEAAKAINPNLPRLHIDVGNMLQAQGKFNEAIDSYRNANALGKASQFAKEASDLEPANPLLRGNLGRMYYHNNDLDEAIIQLNYAVRGGQDENGVWIGGLPLSEPDKLLNPRVTEFYDRCFQLAGGPHHLWPTRKHPDTGWRSHTYAMKKGGEFEPCG